MSAAAGGITSVIEHPLTYPPVTTAELYREKREMAKSQGRHRLRPVGRADTAVDPRDRRAVAGGRGWLQGVHADLRSVLSERHRRRVPGRDARGAGGRRPGAGARRERFAAPGGAGPDARRWPPRPDGPPRVASAVRRGGGRPPRALPGRARRRPHPDRARVQPHQRRPGAAREGRRAAGHDGDLPAPPAARPGRPRPARPVRRLRPGPPRAGAGRAAVGRGAGRHRRLSRLRPRRLHAGGEGAGMAGHLRWRRSAAR